MPVFPRSVLALAVAAAAPQLFAQPIDPDQVEEVIVTSQAVAYANADVSAEMLQRVAPIASPLAAVATLPGVLVDEGDQFGGDDWSTFISIRGFQTNLDEQQIGMTVDGIPNGNSNYGGGAKANRFIDTPNLETVRVSQGTADITSRSNEALGGTLDFITDAPLEEQQMRVMLTVGENDAQKYYVRFDTGRLFDDTTTAWLSLSSSDAKTWIDESGESNREHAALKFITDLDALAITGYFSWDDVHEDNYQRVSLEQFEADPGWDRLTAEWTGIPYIDQVYRRGWSTLRENKLAYLKFDFATGPVDWKLNTYWHDNEGRGDWMPPYVVDLIDDNGGPETELVIGPQGGIDGGSPIGTIYFVDANGVALSPNEGCTSSITFPYGGAGPQYDPGCYDPGAIPVSSYRTTNYWKERYGANADVAWTLELGDNLVNTLGAGLWWEDYDRDETRTWQNIIDATSSYRFDKREYWTQYDRSYEVNTLMYYVQDKLQVGPVSLNLGVKQFIVDLERSDNFSGEKSGKVDSDSDPLYTVGAVVDIPFVDGLSAFAGYAENFAAIKDEVLERESSAVDDIEPETAENIDVGLRYDGERILATLTYYEIDFDNRLTFIAPDNPAGIDYTIGTNGTYLNVGGVESKGIELAGSWQVSDAFRVYASFTDNDSQYLGTGNAALDDSLGIFPGNTVAGSAQRMAALSLDWTHNHYRAGLTTRWVDERELDQANSQQVPDYTVSDLYVGVGGEELGEFLRGVDISFLVNNLFDEEYLGGISGGAAWIGPGRSASLTVTADF
ncbi:TonB-dependent receptor [Mangrovimicrobium sediminis]|uniref:TonB-dependent receptor n=1 Tax=Mangrovimicrobium sediminis TaxID=2562682 RepID=A0A4Z0LW72_9GAMM|nr:TonB-dependent receptor [Haliea sp. SAOS-164]TGD71509.1 TonB-dependent receptor [Haliea sp. SAOS-164]